MELIRHEHAHLAAFEHLAAEEGITDDTCLRFGETFDAAMTEEAWIRLKGAYEAMRRDHGDDNDMVQACRLVEDADEAQNFTQMKGAMGAVVHPAGQMYGHHCLLTLRQSCPANSYPAGLTNSCTLCCASCSTPGT